MLRNRHNMGFRDYVLSGWRNLKKTTTVQHFRRFFEFVGSSFGVGIVFGSVLASDAKSLCFYIAFDPAFDRWGPSEAWKYNTLLQYNVLSPAPARWRIAAQLRVGYDRYNIY